MVSNEEVYAALKRKNRIRLIVALLAALMIMLISYHILRDMKEAPAPAVTEAEALSHAELENENFLGTSSPAQIFSSQQIFEEAVRAAEVSSGEIVQPAPGSHTIVEPPFMAQDTVTSDRFSSPLKTGTPKTKLKKIAQNTSSAKPLAGNFSHPRLVPKVDTPVSQITQETSGSIPVPGKMTEGGQPAVASAGVKKVKQTNPVSPKGSQTLVKDNNREGLVENYPPPVITSYSPKLSKTPSKNISKASTARPQTKEKTMLVDSPAQKPKEVLLTLQVTALSDPIQAEILKNKLRQAGFPSRVENIKRGDMALYRVRIGVYKDAKQADQLRTKLEAAGYTASITVQ
ncbi:MAG: SPOR domain-containing protein [Neisseriaceae bacterium]